MTDREHSRRPRALSSDPERNLLLRNRPSHLRDRDLYYQRALEDLDLLVERLTSLRESPGGLEQLRAHVEQLALDFKRALYHAILAAGGDFGRTRVPGISREEMVYSDYLKTMYSAARNVEAYLSHELMLMHFADSEELGPLVRQYIQQTKTYDQDVILRTIDLMVSRAAIFNKTFLHHGSEREARSLTGPFPRPEAARAADTHAEL